MTREGERETWEEERTHVRRQEETQLKISGPLDYFNQWLGWQSIT